ncbi:MAG: phosphatidylserine/phosphatidylglycerophosphate/cardiolipin synthase family protein [Bacteroidetes bacterium]|nr:phosphatidylserine/phosphatidylglycerophosphate/cardiolipin synthase family protein [Bacteroidota bacterium]
MPFSKNPQYRFYDDPLRMFNAMIEDIEHSEDYIYLETYKYGNDQIGIKFRDALTCKAKQGVKIKVMIDSWGAYVSESFFAEMIKFGGEVRFFKKIKPNIDFFTKGHKRNHRKLLIIDDKITYISSSNIAEYALNWRESSLRLAGDITKVFKETFIESYRIYNKLIYDKFSATKILFYNDFEIMPNVPSTVLQAPTRKKFLELIKSAKKEIIIETPYFLPGSFMRKALMDAALRGVNVNIISPQHSDVNIVDILRNKYLGEMHKNKVNFLFYTPRNLHCKIFMTDRTNFVIGSSNFDYRSFRFMHEIDLFGKEKKVIKLLEEHIQETIGDCIPFDYEKWVNRTIIQRIFEVILIPFRHLF